jgi:Ca2+-binding RTX toxin-like protein
MASSNYSESGIGSNAIVAMVQAGILTSEFLVKVDKEAGVQTTSVQDDFRNVASGTDFAIINNGGTVILGELDSKTIKDLNALIFSTEENVTLYADKNFKANVSFGAGDDTYFYSGSKAQTISGGDGNDTISTGNGNDSIQAGAGNDSILTGAGNDTVLGGAGNDTIKTGSGNDSIVTGNGNDSIDAGAGNDKITVVTQGAVGNSDISINGGKGSDTLDLLGAGDLSGTVNTTNKTAQITLSDGTTLDVSNVEKFVIDTNGDGKAETINLTGLADFLNQD